MSNTLIKGQSVDFFTGDLKCSLPVMTVPSPDGPPIPLVLNYSGGIRVAQKASWIGLGWTLQTGAIQRQVNGVPDDYKGNIHHLRTFNGAAQLNLNEISRYYGPLKYKDFYEGIALDNNFNVIGTPSQSIQDEFKERVMDSYTSYYPEELTTFEFPDYDNFYITGPGVGGTMKPFLFEHNGKLKHHEPLGSAWLYPFTNSAQFRMLGEGNSIQEPAYYKTGTTLGTVMNQGTSNWYYSRNGNQASFINANTAGYDISANSIQTDPTLTTNLPYQGAINTSIDRPHNTTYIKYYTNQEIINLLNGNAAHDFIEALELTVSDRQNLGATDIGAFSITNLQGYTYHYSLPVYNQESSQFVAEYNNSNQIDSLKLTTKDGFVVTWLLTAVTGPDYEDADNNHKISSGDKGYWVKYKYGKWADAFHTQVPFFGLTSLYNENPVSETYQGMIYEDATSKSQSKSINTIWYLDYIQTASHTALFVKEVRKDEHSKPVLASSPMPLLKLNQIVLMRTEDADNYNWTSNTALLNATGFNVNNVNKNQVLHSGVFNQNAVPTTEILASVSFEQDYKLSPLYHNNINTTVNAGAPLNLLSSSNWMEDFKDQSVTTSASNNNISGKLTLNKVQFYGFENNDKLPYFEFTYGHNPLYNPDKVDYWGYYNGQATSGGLYTNEVNQNDVHAWSLTSISSPYSGVTTIEYESDKYEYVGKERPLRVFKATSSDLPNFAEYSNTSAVVTFDATCKTFYQNNASNVDFVRLRVPFWYHYSQNTGSAWDTHSVFDAKDDPSVMDLTNNSAMITVPNSQIEGVPNPYPQPQNAIPVNTHNAGIAIGLKSAYGGGIRVKSITTQDLANGGTYKTEYTYENGAASQEPSLLAPPYSGRLMNNWQVYDRHQHTPNVGYGKITVSAGSVINGGSNTIDAPLKEVYNFYTYNSKDVSPIHIEKKYGQRFITNSQTTVPGNITTYPEIRKFEVVKIEDRKSFDVGKLYRKEVVDEHDNVLSQVNNRFKSGNHTAEYFVGIDNSTIRSKYVNETPWGVKFRGDFYSRLLTSSIFIKDYRTQLLDYQMSYSNGARSRFEVLERDPLVGVPTKTKRNNDETTIITERTMAYTLPQYSAMGLKSVNTSNDNFLTAVAKEKVFKNDQLVSGYYNNFNRDMLVRKYSGGSYQNILETDKQWYVKETFAFDGIVDETQWTKVSEATLFNEKGNLLETKDNFNRYAAIKYGYDNRFTVASLGDGKYSEFTFSGAEDLGANGFFSGEVSKGNGSVVGTQKHTGYYSLSVPSNNTGFTYTSSVSDGIEPERTYKASVWLYDNGNTGHTANLSYSYGSNTASVNKQSSTTIKAGNWYLLTLEIPIPMGSNNTLTVQCNAGNGTAFFDDFRFHPRDESIQTYVYDPVRGHIMAVLDSENFYARFEYDNLGKLFRTYRETTEGEKLVTETTYNIIEKQN